MDAGRSRVPLPWQELEAATPSLDGKELFAVRERVALQVVQYDPRSRRLAATALPRGLEGRFSPDGQWTLPGKPEKAYVVSSEGGAPEQVLPGERHEVDVDWSPDGRSLIFGRPPDGMAEKGLPKAIHLVDLATKQVSTLPIPKGSSLPPGPPTDASWSPRLSTHTS